MTGRCLYAIIMWPSMFFKRVHNLYMHRVLFLDVELTVDEKYKKTLDEIESLKDHLGT